VPAPAVRWDRPVSTAQQQRYVSSRGGARQQADWQLRTQHQEQQWDQHYLHHRCSRSRGGESVMAYAASTSLRACCKTAAGAISLVAIQQAF
jgi:hypothetical protein